MPSAYPAALDTFATNHTDSTTSATTHPTVHNDNADAINKIEAELGVNPKGSFASVLARLNAQLTVRKTADQTFSSTVTPANVTDLVFAVASGISYTFKFTLMYQSNTLTNGIRLALTTPTFAAGNFSAAVQIFGRANETAGTAPALATLPTYEGKILASAGQVTSDAVAAINTSYIATIEGIIIPSAAGNLQVQAANEVSTASGNIVKVGSNGVLNTG